MHTEENICYQNWLVAIIGRGEERKELSGKKSAKVDYQLGHYLPKLENQNKVIS